MTGSDVMTDWIVLIGLEHARAGIQPVDRVSSHVISVTSSLFGQFRSGPAVICPFISVSDVFQFVFPIFHLVFP